MVSVCVLHRLKRLSILSSLISQCWIRSFSKVQISFLVFASAVQRDFDMKQGHGCRGTALNIAYLLRCYLHGPVHIDILVWLAGGLLNKIGSSALWTSCRNSHRLIQEMKWIQWHCDLWTVKLATSFSFRTLQSMPLFFSVRSIYQVLVELVELSSKVAVLELSVLLLHDWLKRPIKWKMQRCHPSQPKRK